MELKTIMELQALFDKGHSGIFNWSVRRTEEKLEVLQFLLICIMGELGEAISL